MPRKAKKENHEPIDIVEIDYDEETERQEVNGGDFQSGAPQQEPTSREREAKPLSEKRLEALAKGREKARLNRLKKKEEEKEQLKQEIKEQLKQELSPVKPKRSQSEQTPPIPSSESEEELRMHEVKPKSPKKEESAKQKKKEVTREARLKEQTEKSQTAKHVVKQSKAEEQKKVLQKAKKNIPVFKEESKPKRESRIKDFFKPKKVIEVSDSESD